MRATLAIGGLLTAWLVMDGFPRKLRADDVPLHSAVTPVPRTEDWWNTRHTAVVNRVAQGSVDLLFLGDSITQGWEVNGADAWQQYYGDRNAVNAGFSGDRTQHVLWRLQNGEIEGINPKAAVLMIGTNNSASNTSQEIADGVTAIVDLLQAELPDTKTLVLGIFPRGATPANAQRQVNVGANALISELGQREGVTYLDISDVFLDDEGNLSKTVMPDRLHLNVASYWTWAEAMEPTLAELLGESTPAAVPEPGTLALLAVPVPVLLLVWRRRRPNR